MFAQSTAVLTQPSVATFEKFEWRGGVQSAFIYVLIAAVVSAIVSALFAPLHNVSFWGQFFSQLIGVPVGFAVFTGAVYYIGKALFKGTGTYPEVAYTFALFYVPLAIANSLIGWIPVLNIIMGILVALALIYYGFLAVQSSMNVRTNGEGVALLILSGIAYWIVTRLLALLVLSLFVVR